MPGHEAASATSAFSRSHSFPQCCPGSPHFVLSGSAHSVNNEKLIFPFNFWNKLYWHSTLLIYSGPKPGYNSAAKRESNVYGINRALSLYVQRTQGMEQWQRTELKRGFGSWFQKGRRGSTLHNWAPSNFNTKGKQSTKIPSAWSSTVNVDWKYLFFLLFCMYDIVLHPVS